jgi:hypothetical protein
MDDKVTTIHNTIITYEDIHEILLEWRDLHRKGKIILHSDGNGIKKIEFNYYID